MEAAGHQQDVQTKPSQVIRSDLETENSQKICHIWVPCAESAIGFPISHLSFLSSSKQTTF